MPSIARSVLIAEDNPDLQEIYKIKLEADGYSVTTAADGRQAFDRIREHKPDLILLDIMMPGMDGLEFLRRAGKDKEFRDLPIIVMTNLGQDEDREQCEKYGVRRFLVKTETSVDDLSRIVKETIG